jgi:hypothetical protein
MDNRVLLPAVMCLCVACVIPLGRPSAPRAENAAPTDHEQLCDSIARERDIWTTTSTILGTLGGGSGIASIPSGDEAKPALQTASASLALGAVVAGIIAAERSARYTRVCP